MPNRDGSNATQLVGLPVATPAVDQTVATYDAGSSAITWTAKGGGGGGAPAVGVPTVADLYAAFPLLADGSGCVWARVWAPDAAGVTISGITFAVEKARSGTVELWEVTTYPSAAVKLASASWSASGAGVVTASFTPKATTVGKRYLCAVTCTSEFSYVKVSGSASTYAGMWVPQPGYTGWALAPSQIAHMWAGQWMYGTNPGAVPNGGPLASEIYLVEPVCP